MGNLVVLDLGKELVLKKLVNQAGGGIWDALSVRLYTNNHAPAHGDTLSAFTEAAFSGYAAGTINTESAVALDGATPPNAYSNPATITFTNGSGAPVNVYGVFVTDAGNTTAYIAGLFSGAPVSIPAGGTLQVTLTLTAQSAN